LLVSSRCSEPLLSQAVVTAPGRRHQEEEGFHRIGVELFENLGELQTAGAVRAAGSSELLVIAKHGSSPSVDAPIVGAVETCRHRGVGNLVARPPEGVVLTRRTEMGFAQERSFGPRCTRYEA